MLTVKGRDGAADRDRRQDGGDDRPHLPRLVAAGDRHPGDVVEHEEMVGEARHDDGVKAEQREHRGSHERRLGRRPQTMAAREQGPGGQREEHLPPEPRGRPRLRGFAEIAGEGLLVWQQQQEQGDGQLPSAPHHVRPRSSCGRPAHRFVSARCVWRTARSPAGVTRK
ncbi:hypothetical protein D3C83_01880 [compost metagenome]